jgi:succinate dehydrogenase / fumarate reductase iron-sulfur subunit
MVELALPKNSSPRGQDLAEAGRRDQELREFKIYRWSPDDGENPRIDTYWVDSTIAGRWFSTR